MTRFSSTRLHTTQTNSRKRKLTAGIALAAATAIAIPTGAFALWSVTVQDPGPTTIQTGEFELSPAGWNWWLYGDGQWRKMAAGEGTFYGTYARSSSAPQMQGTQQLNLKTVGTALRVKLKVDFALSNSGTFELGIFNDTNGNDILDAGETKIIQSNASTTIEREYAATDIASSWKAYAIPQGAGTLPFGSDANYTATITYTLTQLRPQA